MLHEEGGGGCREEETSCSFTRSIMVTEKEFP
jgi:hypothetical protein